MLNVPVRFLLRSSIFFILLFNDTVSFAQLKVGTYYAKEQCSNDEFLLNMPEYNINIVDTLNYKAMIGLYNLQQPLFLSADTALIYSFDNTTDTTATIHLKGHLTIKEGVIYIEYQGKHAENIHFSECVSKLTPIRH